MIQKNIYAQIFFQINCLNFLSAVIRVSAKIRILPQNSRLCGNAFFDNWEQKEESPYI